MPLEHLSAAGLSAVGWKRKNNEDALLLLRDHGVFCVADGMGGAAHGELASQAAVESVRYAFESLADSKSVPDVLGKADLVDKALNQAALAIMSKSQELHEDGMGTTAVALVFDAASPCSAMALHAGDSRAYRFRNNSLLQLTSDHSVAEAAGVTDERLLPHIFQGVITRAVGIKQTVEMERTPVDVMENDIFLLCSDGLTRMVPDKYLRRLFSKHGKDNLEHLAHVLIDKANQAGGDDNITVILVRAGKSLHNTSKDGATAVMQPVPGRFMKSVFTAVLAGAAILAAVVALLTTHPKGMISQSAADSTAAALPVASNNATLTTPGADFETAQTHIADTVKATLANGEWHKLATQVELWKRHGDVFADEPRAGKLYGAWLELWQNARDNSPEAETRYQALLELAKSIEKAGLMPCPDCTIITGESPEAQAVHTCRLMHALQQHLTEAAGRAALDFIAQLRFFGPDPSALLRRVWLFSEYGNIAGADSTAAKVMEARKNIQQLKKWADTADEMPMTISEIGSCPLSLVPAIIRNCNEAWAEAGEMLTRLEPRFSSWRNTGDDRLRPHLDRAEELYRQIILDRERFGTDPNAWRAGADYGDMTELMMELDNAWSVIEQAR